MGPFRDELRATILAAPRSDGRRPARRTIYEAAWRRRFGTTAAEWLARRAATRRWRPMPSGNWRLLGAGSPNRSRSERAARPRLCACCGAPAAGLAWCVPCGPPAGAARWDIAQRGWRDTTGGEAARPSPYGICLLCGTGEARAEHLLRWCPAVGHDCERVLGRGATLEGMVFGPPTPADPSVTALLHQAVCMHTGAASGSTVLGTARAAAVLGARSAGS